MRIGIAEILKNANDMPSRQEKIDYLRTHDSSTLREAIVLALDPRVKWVLPEGDPPYKPSPYLDQENMLYSEMRKMYLFLEGGHPTLPQIKRESLFLALLEGLNPEDAKLILAAKNKTMPYETLTPELFNEAFPGLLLIEEKPVVETKSKKTAKKKSDEKKKPESIEEDDISDDSVPVYAPPTEADLERLKAETAKLIHGE